MNLTNYHSHCSLCDGKAPMEDFIKAAIENNFTAYGISSHAPLPFFTKWSLPEDKLSIYLNELSRLKEKYINQIEIYSGLEIDYLNDEYCPSIPYFQKLSLDYRIGSVHMIINDDGEVIDTDANVEKFKQKLDTYLAGDLRKAVELYYKSMMRLIDLGGIDFVAHPDKIYFSAERLKPSVTKENWYKQFRNDLFAFIAEKEMIMEVNTKAYYNNSIFFPSVDCFKQIKDFGLRVVVNSDAHHPELINAGRKEAFIALKAAGISNVCEFHNREWLEVGIEL